MSRLKILISLLLSASAAHAQFIVNNGVQINNSALVSTNGDWSNDASTVILNNGTISTTQSFTNNGTLLPSAGGFDLNFASELNFIHGGRDLGFIIKRGAGNALVTGGLSLRDSLLLKDGLFTLTRSTDTVFVAGGGIVTGSPSSYVNGFMARGGTGLLLFPIGTDGLYLPVSFYKAQASRITVSLIDTPAGITAGPGVDALIDFPYAWKVDEKIQSDTAAYVELSYPVSLPVAENPIVVRQTPGWNTYSSMGARFIENTGGFVTVRSYSRGLKGTFSIAKGFPIDTVTDSLALVALFDSTSGAGWTTKTNWNSGPVDSWFGVVKTGQTITSVSLPGNNLLGKVPDQFVDIMGLQTVDLSDNELTSIADFTSNTEITSLDVSGNNLTFQSLEPNASVPGLHYVDQAPLLPAFDSLVAVGSPYTFEADAGGESTTYQWLRNGSPVTGATGATYEVATLNRTNMGDYILEATNPLLPALKLKTEVQNILAYATISGTMKVSANEVATSGKMTLFRITPAAYDTVSVKAINPDGSFSFEKVVLDDYQLLGFADTLVYEGSLPTYYVNTIFWEEADTLFLEDNMANLTIVSDREPGPSSGKGLISGYVQEDDGSGRSDDIMVPKKISKAGVSVRRVENTGRGKAEVLTLTAYVFTNDDGEFSLSNLPEGLYRLNIQYPGYPMDVNSFINIQIGSGFKSEVRVEANVEGDKITVRQLIITDVYEKEEYTAEVYPNPAVDFVQMNFGREVPGREAVVMDINGRKVLGSAIEGKTAKIGVQQLQRGLYLLHILEHGTIVKTVKVSIQ